LDGRVHCRYK